MKKVIIMFSVLLLLSACSNNNVDVNKDYEAKINEATKLLDDGMKDNAILAFKEAIELDKTNDEAYLALYDIYLANNDYLACGLLLDEAIKNTQSDKIEALKDELNNNGYSLITNSFKTNTEYDKYFGHNLNSNLPLAKKELHYTNIFKNVYAIYQESDDEFLVYQTNSSKPVKFLISYNDDKISSFESDYTKYYFDDNGYLLSYVNYIQYDFSYDDDKIVSIVSNLNKYLYKYEDNKLDSIISYLDDSILN